ncbi:MAG: hypothetical protein GWO07_13045 [Candidatus Dadabacteria bacterium]|nr:hypothetical protein [Candidatus Dadabacteria bacterium]NIS09656.1 hypothetical protein [Candidatus Dadabacteria bacterium]NIV41134.1 hypothetical protein [Candidatus Dadabacteria bacterium]NIX16127.1 hypothetical protein [Candidatus Dadabacteria bacterium]NIY21677.1 hypothetical protein [Candidatus Dadabacteria bacterium]
MKCDDIKALYDGFKSEMLTANESSAVSEHLAGCTDCNDYYFENKKLARLLDNWDEISPQSNYVSKFWNRVDEQELNKNKGFIGLFKGIKTAFLVPSLAIALFCSLLIVNMYRTTNIDPQVSEEDERDNRLLLEVNDIISQEGSESLKIYGLWNDLEEEPKEG